MHRLALLATAALFVAAAPLAAAHPGAPHLHPDCDEEEDTRTAGARSPGCLATCLYVVSDLEYDRYVCASAEGPGCLVYAKWESGGQVERRCVTPGPVPLP